MARQRRLQRSYLLLGLSLAMILVGCGMLLYVGQHAAEKADVTSAGTSTEIPAQCAPAETAEPNDALSQVPGFTVPTRIMIDRIGVDAPVVPVTVVGGVLQIPEDVNQIGWYREGATPEGLSGSSVLVGHRDGEFGIDGAFYDLATLTPGDVVSITDAGGVTSTYQVVSREVISKSRFANVAEKYFTLEGSPRLTLITCGGYFDRDNGGYQANVIVTARRVTHAKSPS